MAEQVTQTLPTEQLLTPAQGEQAWKEHFAQRAYEGLSFDQQATLVAQERLYADPTQADAIQPTETEPRVGSATDFRDAAWFDVNGRARDSNGEAIFPQTPDEVRIFMGMQRYKNPLVRGGKPADVSYEDAFSQAVTQFDTERAQEQRFEAAVQSQLAGLTDRQAAQRAFAALPRTEQARLRTEEKAISRRETWPPDIEMYDLGDEAGPKELSPDEAVELLSYGDVLSGDAKADAVRYTETNQSGQKYVAVLQGMTTELGSVKLQKLAESLRDQCLTALAQLGAEPSEFGKSLSWAYWDLAKQRYYATHPAEVMAGYSAHDPLENSQAGADKRREIVYRHIGWEMSQLAHSGALSQELQQSSAGLLDTTLGEAIKHGKRNESGQLPSSILAGLGGQAIRSQVGR